MTISARTLARVLVPVLLAVPSAGFADATPPFRVPVPVERTLPNGLRVAVFPDHRLPLVHMQLLIPAGTAQEPAETPGVAGAVAQLLRAGTSSRTAAALTDDLERLAGGLTGSAGPDFSAVSATFLAADFSAGLELLADCVVNPVFPPRELERVRGQFAARLSQAQQDPAVLADVRLWEAVFGQHPYGASSLGSLSALARMSWETVQAFHRDFYRPDHAVLAVAGDVDPDRVFAAAADRFGAWAGRAAATPAPTPPAPPASPRVVVVDRPGLERSEVRIGFLGPPRANPDATALQLANHLLAGRQPSSRLGRALAAGGGLAPGDLRDSYTILKDAGLLSLGGSVRADSVAVFVAKVRAELEGLAARPPDQDRVEAARRAFADGFPLQLQTPGALVAQWLGADSYGLGPGWLERHVAEVAAVTPARVAEAAARWLDPAHMVVVAVGPAATLEPALRGLGTVEVVAPDEVPAAARPPATAAPDAEQMRRGRELLDRALEAHGGLARLRRVKDSSVDAVMVMQIAGNDIELAMQAMRKEPYRMRYSTRAIQTENGQVLAGTRGWTYVGVGDSLVVSELDSIGVAAMRAVFGSDVVHTLLAAAEPAVQLVARGPGRADGRDVEVLEVVRPAAAGTRPERSLLHLDAVTHRLVAEDVAEDPVHPGVFRARRVYRDHRLVDGVLWPFYEERHRSGVRTMSITVRTVTLDSGLSDAWFERPGLPQRSGPLR